MSVQQLWEAQGPLIATGAALVIGFVAVGLAYRVLRLVGRRVALLAAAARRTHKPAQLLVALLMAQFTVHLTTETGAWRGPLLHGLLLGAIGAGGWLVASLLLLAEATVTARLDLDDPDNLEARRAHTQLLVLRRVTIAVVGVLTIGAALYTFPAVRGIGASLLASAGLLGVIGGLAAQSTLSNLFAGLQLAFGNRLSIEDVVVVEGEWGTVEELTLGYVVINVWDERRLILPTSYFTTYPFVNWTRSGQDLLGTVELDLDWTVPVPELRAELERFVRDHPAWDGRVVSLLVTDATGGLVRVRPLISAEDADRVWELRCVVREHLVEWVRRHYPDALPRTRHEISRAGAADERDSAERGGQAGLPTQAAPGSRP